MVSALQRRFVVTDGANLHFVSAIDAKEALGEVTNTDRLQRWPPKGIEGLQPEWYVAPVTEAQQSELSSLTDLLLLEYVLGLLDLSGYR
ncbi:hypothetical protein B7H17_03250 [Pseudomonas putida]|uniref:Uncharacterized protein n=1 Tax=Pseudomonas putida TaxID=303 RepID=A0A1X1A5X4_PSEPU|nr:hypothetical protein B7H17_03250 [Pseudomonas putida]